MVWDEVDDSFERRDVTVCHIVWEPLEGERGHKGSLVVLVLPNQDIGKKNVQLREKKNIYCQSYYIYTRTFLIMESTRINEYKPL